LDGTHPVFTQVPPTVPRSAITTEAPASWVVIAAANASPPDPVIARSCRMIIPSSVSAGATPWRAAEYICQSDYEEHGGCQRDAEGEPEHRPGQGSGRGQARHQQRPGAAGGGNQQPQAAKPGRLPATPGHAAAAVPKNRAV
jgi:hypothetical protein